MMQTITNPLGEQAERVTYFNDLKKQLNEKAYDSIFGIELNNCKHNWKYFCDKYGQVDHPVKGRIEFHPYDFQVRVVGEYDAHQFNIIRKCRQLGLSTTTAMYVLWKCLFHPGFFVVILSKSQREAKEFLKKVRVAYQAIGLKDVKGDLLTDSVHELEFENGSRVISLPSNSGRSFACSLLILDEAAFCRNMDTLWAEALPTLSTGGRCIVISTTHGTTGMGKWYFETWRDAEAGVNDFNPIQLYWWEHPEYDEKWAQKMLRQLKPKRFKQEILGHFIGTGNTFLSSRVLEHYENSIKEPILKKEYGRLWIWELPRQGVVYGMAVDTSSGTGTDYSAFQLFRLDTMEQVAEYMTKTHTQRFATIVRKWGLLYNTASMIVERNSMGQGVADMLYYTMNYPAMYMEKPKMKIKKPGWTTTEKSRSYITQAIENTCVTKTATIRSSRLVRQLQTFVIKENTGKIEADSGANDDLVIPLGIMAHTRDKLLSLRPISFTGTNIQYRAKSVADLFADKNREAMPEQAFFTTTTYTDQDVSWLYD
jgi:hypothetical protein